MAEISFREGPATIGEMIKILEMQEATKDGDTLESIRIIAELMAGRTDEDIYKRDSREMGDMTNDLMKAMGFDNNGPNIPDAFKDWK